MHRTTFAITLSVVPFTWIVMTEFVAGITTNFFFVENLLLPVAVQRGFGMSIS